ncbi:MAG: hypothetical protein JWO38_6230 [Gemmataceae bacterium]|nr:hypothetical protein [Gemmataceae bacterium]
MRNEDEDDDYDRDDASDADDRPTFPIAVKIAGIVWIGFGILEFMGAAFSLATAGMNAGAGGPVGGCCPGLIGVAFLVCGYQTVAGTAKDTRGNGIGSILLGLLQVVVGVAIGVLGLGPKNQGNNDPAVLIVIAIFLGVLGTTLIVAGALALSGRTAYKEWRHAQRPSRRPRRRPRDDEDEDERPRRRPRRDDDD